MKKQTCKICVAGFGLTWRDREDVIDYWKDTEAWWEKGTIVCPVAITQFGRFGGDLGLVDAGPPSWCPHGFEDRIRKEP